MSLQRRPDLLDFLGPFIPGKWLPVSWLKDTSSRRPSALVTQTRMRPVAIVMLPPLTDDGFVARAYGRPGLDLLTSARRRSHVIQPRCARVVFDRALAGQVQVIGADALVDSADFRGLDFLRVVRVIGGDSLLPAPSELVAKVCYPPLQPWGGFVHWALGGCRFDLKNAVLQIATNTDHRFVPGGCTQHQRLGCFEPMSRGDDVGQLAQCVR